MDTNRQIRFIVAPFFFFSSIMWGAYLAGIDLGCALGIKDWENLVAIIALVSIIVFPIGFMINAITALAVRYIYWLAKKRSYDANISDDAIKRIWPLLDTNLILDEAKKKEWEFHTAATYDHELLDKGIHEWIMRTWSYFTIAANSCGAIVLSHIAGIIMGISLDYRWVLTSTIVLFILGISGWHSRKRIKEMIEFQSYRNSKPKMQKA